ncbi:hypothetical protein [Leifsonia poae]|uniref:hypothetical protein n=1 Tax=Leifsonia poae TaxID=110933 RepID=UPI003D674B89
MTAQGKADSSGGFAATALTLSAKGAEGCSTFGTGRPGERPGTGTGSGTQGGGA